VAIQSAGAPTAGGTGGRNAPAALAAGSDQAFAGEIVSRSFLDIISRNVNEMSHVQGSKEILMLSPGFIGMPGKEQDQVITQTVAAGVVINVLDSKSAFRELTVPESEQIPPLPPASYTFDVAGLGIEQAMADFAYSTGGLFFHHDGDKFSHGYLELGDIPDMSYILALHSDTSDAKYHHLKVQVKSSGSAAVEARSGYYPLVKVAATADPPAADNSALRAKLDAQVVSMTPVTEFPFTVGLAPFEKMPDGKTKITVLLHADLKDLAFATRNSRHTQKLTLVAAVFDENDKMVSAKEGLMEFLLSDGKFNSIKNEGVGASLVLEAGPGLYRLCTVGQDVDGKMASTLNKIQVP
jgi:hypothetical protein